MILHCFWNILFFGGSGVKWSCKPFLSFKYCFTWLDLDSELRLETDYNIHMPACIFHACTSYNKRDIWICPLFEEHVFTKSCPWIQFFLCAKEDLYRLMIVSSHSTYQSTKQIIYWLQFKSYELMMCYLCVPLINFNCHKNPNW